MPDAYAFIDASGLILPDTSAIKDTVEAEYKNAFGEDFITTPESPGGLLIGVETEGRDDVARNNAELANQINPDYAGGIFLDAIAALTGLKRRGAEASTVKAALAGIPGTIIPAGVRAATDGGDTFYAADNLVLGDDGKGEVWFRSEVLDAIPAPAGTLTRIVDPVLGWETITNPAAASMGQPVETDAQFRKRRKDTLALQGVALPSAIISGVLDVPGVRSMAFRENYSNEARIIDGAEIPANTIYAVVDGGTDEDVAKMLFEKKSLGCGWMGKIEVEVTCPESGQKYLVRFDRPEEVPVRISAKVRATGSASVDYETLVRQAVMDYADDKLESLRGLLVSAAVSPFDLSAAINMVNRNIYVVNLSVGLFTDSPADLKPETMHLNFWQKATITLASIDVAGG